MRTPKTNLGKPFLALIALGAGLALSGCQTSPPQIEQLPLPTLQLMDSQPLVIAADCMPSGSYFIGFTVLRDGRTDNIQAAPRGPTCVQQALTTWVSSFRYYPPIQEMQVGIEWMMVAGHKGI
jgi:hypothetical protein